MRFRKRLDLRIRQFLTSVLRGGTVTENSLPPILRLPPEVLELIFIHAAQDYYHENYARVTNFCVPSWVNVSYVCRLWRWIAVDCPTLWSYHFVVSLRWTDELLARSKQAPLKISISLQPGRHTDWWPCLVVNLLSHMERIQELRLCLPHWFFPEKLSLRAPRLQRLEIEWSGAFGRRIEVTDEHIPPLRALRLVDCMLPLQPSMNLSRLTTLSLSRISSHLRLNTMAFLSMLGGMEDLTVLHIENVFTCAPGLISSQEFDAVPRVNLHHLAHLTVIAPHSTLVAFLSRISIPFRTEVRLDFGPDDSSSPDDYTPVSSFLTQTFNTSESSAPTFRSLEIYIRPWEPALTFSASDCSRDTRHLWMFGEWGCNIPLTVVLRMKRENWNNMLVNRIISDMCCSMPPESVQSLHIIRPPSSLGFWKTALGHLSRLRYMRLSHGCMPNLASVLSHCSDKPLDKSDQGSTLFVPELEELELIRIEFARVSSGIAAHAISKKSLNDALATRKEFRPRLTMTDCYAERYDVK